jgi:uncharacterized membrane protein
MVPGNPAQYQFVGINGKDIRFNEKIEVAIMKTFSIQEALSVGWAAFKSRFGLFIGLLLLYAALTAIPQWGIQQIKDIWLAVPLAVIIVLFEYFLKAGIIKISLAVADGGDAQIGDLFSGWPVFVPLLLATLLFALAIGVGLVLAIVPGIIFSIMFQYYGYFIVDKKMGPVDALKASAVLTRGVRWKLFGFGLVIGLLNIGGALLLLVGLFVTVPVSLVAVAHVYRKLLPQTQFV